MTTPYQAQVIADGALSYVPCNELVFPNFDIISGNPQSAIGSTNPTYGNAAPAALGGAQDGFTTGVNSTIAFSNPTSTGTLTLSLEGWFVSSDTVGATTGMNSPAVLVGSSVGFGFNALQWSLGFCNGMQITFGLSDSSTAYQITTSGSYNDGQMHHVVATWDGTTSGTAIIYVDGVQVATGTFQNGTPIGGLSGGNWVCGSNQFSGAGFLGFANNLALYAAILSPAQVLAHYNLGNPPSMTTVPDVVGLDDATAQADIIAALLTVGTITHVVDVAPPNTVISQSPIGGTSALSGDPVALTESLGAVVPDVVNTSATVVAPGIITGAGFVVGLITYEASGVIILGNVIRQSPTAGTFTTGGTPIDLVVSTGLPALTVPDIFGLSQSDAILALLTVGLVPGAIGSAPSPFVPPGLVQAQNPSAGTPVAVGSIVSFVLSVGTPAVGVLFDFEATVISQYANSPTIMQLVQNLNQYIDQSANFANFFNFVWNVDTAVGFGLDIWGKIVGVSRLLQIPNTTDYVGFDNGTRSPPDWQSMGSDQDTPPVGGALYTGFNATSTYLLGDDAYRQLILAKAFANICTTTAPAINTILQNLYGPGTAWVLNTGPMSISYNLNFTPSAIQLAILQQSGVIPTPPGVSVVIVTP